MLKQASPIIIHPSLSLESKGIAIFVNRMKMYDPNQMIPSLKISIVFSFRSKSGLYEILYMRFTVLNTINRAH